MLIASAGGVVAKRARTFDDVIQRNAERMMKEGQRIFRFDTFGDQAFWGDALKLHLATRTASVRWAGREPAPHWGG